MFRFECFWQFFFFQKIKRKDFAQKKVAHFMELTFYFVTLRHRPFHIRRQPKQIPSSNRRIFRFAATQKSAKMHRRKRTYDDGGKLHNFPDFFVY